MPNTTVVAEVAPDADDDPLTHVEKLDHSTTAAVAAIRLNQIFSGALARDAQNRNGPTVKSLVETIVPPLVQRCISREIPETARRNVLQLLVHTRDHRAAPCFVETLAHYAPGKNDDDVGLAAQGVAILKTKEASTALFEVFKHAQPFEVKGAPIDGDISDAMEALSDPAWEASCLAIVSESLDRENRIAYQTTAYRQENCARLLGDLRSEKAIPALINLTASDSRFGTRKTAQFALGKIGQPAVAPLLVALRGLNQDVIERAEDDYLWENTPHHGTIDPLVVQNAPKIYIGHIAETLEIVGHGEATQSMIDYAMKGDPTGRPFVARALTRLPYSPAIATAIQHVYETTAPNALTPTYQTARVAILDSLDFTFDSHIVPWLLKDTLALKGSSDELDEIRTGVLLLAAKLARVDQLADVGTLGRLKRSDGVELSKDHKDDLFAMQEVLLECRNSTNCYLEKLTDPIYLSSHKQFGAIKSAYMMGVLGDSSIRDKLVDRLPKMHLAMARFISLNVIDHLSPKGDVALAHRLRQMVEAAKESQDARKIMEVGYYPMFINRLLVRAR